jgi:inner membrane protein
MDNLTHSLVGLAAAKAGLERLSPRTAVLCIVAANAADFDVITLVFGDRWTTLKYHRGITHSILGTVCLAFIIPIVFYLAELAVTRLRNRSLQINLTGLLVASLIVSATHPLMDWTNNYGVRLLLPWSPRWFYGDLVFIVDPFLWALFGGASFLVTSKTRLQLIAWSALGLVVTLIVLLGSAQRGAVSNALPVRVFWIAVLISLVVLFAKRAGNRWGRKIAIASFVILVAYWGGLAWAHSRAIKEATIEASVMATSHGETISRLAAMPTLANPVAWECVFETDQAAYRFDLSLLTGKPVRDVVRYEKPSPEVSLLVQKASEDRRAQILLGFARFPVVQLSDTDCTTQTLVQFADLRYTEPGKSRGTFALEVPLDCPDQRPIGSK